jgi:hypothetical protein
MPTPDDVPAAVREIGGRLAEPRPMRRGSVSERSMKCGQAGCRCQQDPQARHGPYFSLTRVEEGKTRSRYLDAERAAVARRQVEAGQQFRKDVEAYWQACERWADAQLEAPQAVSEAEAAKKGGSKRPSTRKSSARSKR